MSWVEDPGFLFGEPVQKHIMEAQRAYALKEHQMRYPVLLGDNGGCCLDASEGAQIEGRIFSC